MSTPTRPTRHGDRVAAALVIALAVTMFGVTLGFPDPGQPADPGTAAFPRIVAVALALLGLVVLLRPERVDFLPHRSGLVRVAGVLALSLGYGLTMGAIGFVLTTAAFLAAGLVLMGVRDWLPLVLTVLVMPVLLYLLFSVGLDVFLPRGPLERALLP